MSNSLMMNPVIPIIYKSLDDNKVLNGVIAYKSHHRYLYSINYLTDSVTVIHRRGMIQYLVI